MQYLTPLTDEEAEAAYVRATEKGDRHAELQVLVRNLKAQVDALDARITVLEP
ncbi:MAG: hypothetical protein ACSLE8_07855 [Rhodococcus sp. (in: high G+C Gram-positive bacteria)]